MLNSSNTPSAVKNQFVYHWKASMGQHSCSEDSYKFSHLANCVKLFSKLAIVKIVQKIAFIIIILARITSLWHS